MLSKRAVLFVFQPNSHQGMLLDSVAKCVADTAEVRTNSASQNGYQPMTRTSSVTTPYADRATCTSMFQWCKISDGLIFRDSLVGQVNDRASDFTSGLDRYVKPLSTLIEVWNVL